MQESYQFMTNEVSYEEVGLKGDKTYYVKGYISTDEIDRANEVVTRDAMKSMLNQIKNGNVKLDIEHSTFRGDNDIPVGKIVDAGIDQKGLWVKAILNSDHAKFQEIWGSIKSGFLDAFSIAYKVTEGARDVINGVGVTLLKGLELLNVAITGNLVCRGAKMTESFYKSLKSYIEVKSMTEEVKKKEEVKVKETQPELVEQPKEEGTETETKVEAEPKVEEAKTEVEAEVEVKGPTPLEMIKSLQDEMVQLKSENGSLSKELSELKEYLNKPILKSIANTEVKTKIEENKVKSMFDLIR